MRSSSRLCGCARGQESSAGAPGQAAAGPLWEIQKAESFHCSRDEGLKLKRFKNEEQEKEDFSFV